MLLQTIIYESHTPASSGKLRKVIYSTRVDSLKGGRQISCKARRSNGPYLSRSENSSENRSLIGVVLAGVLYWLLREYLLGNPSFLLGFFYRASLDDIALLGS